MLLFTLSWHSSAPSSKVQPAPQICFQGETVVTSKNHHHQQAPVHHYHPHYQQNKDLHRKLFTAGVSNELARLFLHVPEAPSNIKTANIIVANYLYVHQGEYEVCGPGQIASAITSLCRSSRKQSCTLPVLRQRKPLFWYSKHIITHT